MLDTRMNNAALQALDLFAGCGGSTSGFIQGGGEVVCAVNHNEEALASHAANHPRVEHHQADISLTDPAMYPTTQVLIASPSCTRHSNASGKPKPTWYFTNLFGEVLVEEEDERSRALMSDVCRFAAYHRYQAIIVENVVEVIKWRGYAGWLREMQALGYEYREVFFNSMFAWPVPQSRDRIYIVFWLKKMPAPNLDFHPPAPCLNCERQVEAVQVWKNPHKRWGKYRQQYIYCCPTCALEVRPYYFAAANAVDWSLPITKIGERRKPLKPLKPRTIERIRMGLARYSRVEPLVVDLAHARANRSRPIGEPWPTQTTAQSLGLIAPLTPLDPQSDLSTMDVPLVGPFGEGDAGLLPLLISTSYFDNHVRPTCEPWPTQTTGQKLALAVPPFIAMLYGMSTTRPLAEPLGTMTAGGINHGLVVPPFLTSYYSRADAHRSLAEPMGTVTTEPRHALVAPPFLTSYNGGSDVFVTLNEAARTVTSVARHALVQPGLTIELEEVGFRMLSVDEIKRAMGFAVGYRLVGNQRAQVKQLGNAVTPPVMAMLLQRVMAIFN